MSKQKTLFMGSTKVSAEKTAQEVMGVLVASGARQIASDYDIQGKITGLRFCIESQGQVLAFSLPARTDALVKRLRNDRAQAERVAWRQLLRWTQAQMAMIEAGMVKAEEVYSPYMLQAGGQTLFEALTASRFKGIAAPVSK